MCTEALGSLQTGGAAGSGQGQSNELSSRWGQAFPSLGARPTAPTSLLHS